MRKIIAVFLFCFIVSSSALGQTFPGQVPPGGVLGNYGPGSALSVSVPGALAVFNVLFYGAKGDERTVMDAAIAASGTTLSSASANFTIADNNRHIVVSAGSAGVGSGTYTSGATVTGSTGNNCTLTSFNGGGSGATAQILLTGTNTIAGGSALVVTNVGSGFTSAPTSATLGNGIGQYAATCSGTVTISTIRWYAPFTATMTYVNATTVTLGTAATNTVSGATAIIGTDNSTAILAAVSAANNNNGGTIYFPPGSYMMLSQLVIPNNAGSPPTQVPITLQGQGGSWDGQFAHTPPPPAASQIDLLYSSGPKVQTTGVGILNISNLGFINSGYDTQPFLATSYTTLNVCNNTFAGSGPGNAASANDAITLGVISPYFQGYGTLICSNFFSKIARAVLGGQYANAVVIQNNTISLTSGGNEAIKFDETAGGPGANVISHNLIELTNYRYAINFTNSSNNLVVANTYWDVGPIFVDQYYLSGTSTNNTAFDSSETQATDASNNGFTIIGPWLQNIVGISVGQGNNPGQTGAVPGLVEIYGTTNKLQWTYPAVASANAVLDSSGNLDFNSPQSFNFGPNGATNPTLTINGSASNAATGLDIVAAASGGGLGLVVLSSSTNESMTINAKGGGAIGIGSISTGPVTITPPLTLPTALTYGGVTLSNAVTGTGNMVLSTSPSFGGIVKMPDSSTWSSGGIGLLVALGVGESAPSAGQVYASGLIRTASAGSSSAPSVAVGNSTTGLYSVSTTGAGLSVNGSSVLDYNIGAPNMLTSNALNANSTTQILYDQGTAVITRSGTTLQWALPSFWQETDFFENAVKQLAITTSGITVPTIGSDGGHTTATVCEDTTSHLFLSGSGTLGICAGTSGAQFKTDFTKMEAGLNEIVQIKEWNYRYVQGYGDSGKRIQYGPTAQDVEAVLPDLVLGRDGNGKAINYDIGAFIPISMHAFQQVAERLCRLEPDSDSDDLCQKIKLLH
jgi:hypothetical protein